MCGVIGILVKDRVLEPGTRIDARPHDRAALGDRGPDSSGIAVYADGDPFHGRHRSGAVSTVGGGDPMARVSLVATLVSTGTRWALSCWPGSGPRSDIDACSRPGPWFGRSGVERHLGRRSRSRWPDVRVLGVGRALSVVKDTGRPEETCRRYGIGAWQGYLAVAHTRMATESAVTVLHSHPFVPAPDLCVVHNGSFSNYASVRRRLLEPRAWRSTRTTTRRWRPGSSPAGWPPATTSRRPPAGCMKEMDGFFTLVIATDGAMSVVRDAFACKPRRRGRDRRPTWPWRRSTGPWPSCPAIADADGLRAPARGGLHVDTLSCEELGTRGVNQRLAPLEAPASVQVDPAPGAPQPGRGPHRRDLHQHRGQRRLFPGRPGRRRADGRGPHIDVRRVRGMVGGREPDGRRHPGAGQRLAECRLERARRAHHDRRRRLVTSRDLAQGRAPSPSPGTPGPCRGSWPRPAPSSSAATPATGWATRSTRRSSTWRARWRRSVPTPWWRR